MSRGLIAERAKLSLFAARRGVRLLTGRFYAHPLLRLRMPSSGADRLLIAPQDLRTADPTRASELYAGRFAFAGKVITANGRSPFVLPPPSTEWAEVLTGFGWLRHLRAADSGLTRAQARALVDEWISNPGAATAAAWRPDVVSRRIVSWLTHAPFLLNDADMHFYRRFLRSLTRQVRYLRRSVGMLPDGVPRLQGYVALTFAALCMAGEMRLLKLASRRLSEELDRQILPDGGHISRNPGVLIDLLLDLLPLRQAFGARNMASPAPLGNAVERMMPMLRFFRHGDGAFANFNGMGPTSPDLLATVLAYDDTRGRPVSNAVHSGYQRIEAASAVVLVDTGPPPPMAVSQDAHAGCLAVEFSSGRQRIVVNCGMTATNRAGWQDVARATAAHSTLGLDDVSSCRFATTPQFQKLVGVPILSGPAHVPVERDLDAASSRLQTSHDGYAARFGILHERKLALSADGLRLEGEDALVLAPGARGVTRNAGRFALRFHLHPSVRASRLSHRHGAMLLLPSRDVWTFEAYDHEVELAESIYLAAPHGPRHTVQIVIRGEVRSLPRIGWCLEQVDPAESGTLHHEQAEPQLPL